MSITVTESAKQRLKELISEKPLAIGIRLEVSSGGCAGFSYKFDYLYQKNVLKDTIIEYDNLILAIAQDQEFFVFGTQLDYVDENFSKKFVFKNPNATSNCGCGKSFGV